MNRQATRNTEYEQTENTIEQAVAKQGRAVTGKTAKKKKVLTSGAEK